jgi:signal transduction histidine kinase
MAAMIQPGHHTYSFSDVFEALAHTRNFEEVLDVILATSLRELEADQGSLLLLQGDQAGTHLEMLASHGMPEEIVKRGYVARKGSISEYVIRERRPLILNDTPRTKNYESLADETSTPRKIASALCVPLLAQGKVIGTMNLNRTGMDRPVFTEIDLEGCSVLASQAAILIENRRLQEDLLQNERLAAVGQTVASISHCIKNILAGVKGGVGITQMGLDQNNDELTREGFELLKRSTSTLGNLVLDLLDVTKEREPMRDSFDLCRTMHNVAETLRFKAQHMNVQLNVECPDGPLLYFGDSDQVLRALLNLTANAIEATAEFRLDDTGRVDLSLRRIPAENLPPDTKSDCGKHSIEIRVEDNGPGIPQEVQSRIWELFYSTKGSRGTGIGLAATRKMIEEHGGTIQLESVLNEGSLFRVVLPAVD